jgi:hypothetical protein
MALTSEYGGVCGKSSGGTPGAAPSSGMGMGSLVDGGTVFKRKFRWGMSINPGCVGVQIPEYMVKVAARPNLSIEQTEINSKHGKMWIPGKASWETITVTFYDVFPGSLTSNTTGAGISSLYGWIVSTYDFTSGIMNGLCMGSAIKDYTAVVTLNMYSGCGQVLETWTLLDAWPAAVNWNDLDYSSSEEATIELTLRYADVQYNSSCLSSQGGCCTGCTNTDKALIFE